MLKYKCKTHMQVCALLYQVHKHKEAVIHAKEGIKIAHFLVKDLEQMSLFYTSELLQRKPLEEISIISNFKFSLLEKTSVKIVPILRALRKKMAYEDDDPRVTPKNKKDQTASKSSIGKEEQGGGSEQADMKNLLGYLNQSEWIYSLNIGNIMQIAPLTMQDFMSVASIELELSREYVLEKVSNHYLLTPACSCASWLYRTSAWAPSSASCTSCKRCSASTSTRDATPSTGTARQSRSRYRSCRVRAPWCRTY